MDFNSMSMGGLPDVADPALFRGQGAGDDKLFAVFYMGVLPNEARSIEEGRPIFDDVECVRVVVPGDKNHAVDRPVTVSDKQRFARQYAMFKQGVKEEDQITGTRLTDWPMVGRAQSEELRHLGLRTVEQIAECRDDIVAKVPGLGQLKQAASIWLSKAKGTAEAAKAAKVIEDQNNRIATLEQVVRDQAERMEALMAKHSKV
jgi:hypothetical protein